MPNLAVAILGYRRTLPAGPSPVSRVGNGVNILTSTFSTLSSWSSSPRVPYCPSKPLLHCQQHHHLLPLRPHSIRNFANPPANPRDRESAMSVKFERREDVRYGDAASQAGRSQGQPRGGPPPPPPSQAPQPQQQQHKEGFMHEVGDALTKGAGPNGYLAVRQQHARRNGRKIVLTRDHSGTSRSSKKTRSAPR